MCVKHTGPTMTSGLVDAGDIKMTYRWPWHTQRTSSTDTGYYPIFPSLVNRKWNTIRKTHWKILLKPKSNPVRSESHQTVSNQTKSPICLDWENSFTSIVHLPTCIHFCVRLTPKPSIEVERAFVLPLPDFDLKKGIEPLHVLIVVCLEVQLLSILTDVCSNYQRVIVRSNPKQCFILGCSQSQT